jgi:4-amino-4-deoxy-L-arabinose transferase-like glycosyltransferase
MRPKLSTTLALALVLVLAAALRLYKLDFGMELPYLAHTDEPTQYNPAIRILTTGDLNPHFFNYPSLPIYAYTAVLGAGYGVGRLTGAFRSIADLQPIRTLQMSVGLVGTPQLLLLGRATSALLGTLTVGVAYLLSRSLSGHRWTALLVALLVALSREHVRLSHYMAVDVMATLFCVACLTACTLALVKGKRGWLWAAAILGGLSTSSKYNYALLAIPVALACLLDADAPWGRRAARLVLCGLLFVLAFLATSPYVLLDFEAASTDILHELAHYAGGHLGQTGNSFFWYLGYAWQDNPFYLILGIPGLALAAWRARRAALPVALLAGIYYWLIGRQTVHFGRNALPLLVLTMVGVGAAAEALAVWLPERARGWKLGRGAWRFAPLVLALALIPLLPSLLSLPALLAPPRPSGKALAQAWFDDAFDMQVGRRYISKRGGRPLQFVAESYTVYLDPSRVNVEYVSSMTGIQREGSGQMIRGPEDLIAQGYDVALLGSGMFHRFYDNPDAFPAQVALYDALLGSETLAFDQGPSALAFRGTGLQVHVVLLTERAHEFVAAVEGGLALGPLGHCAWHQSVIG